jgi:hypothetical protein
VVVSGDKEDLQLTDSQIDLVRTVLFLILVLIMPLAGYIGNLFDSKWVVTYALAFYSTAC